MKKIVLTRNVRLAEEGLKQMQQTARLAVPHDDEETTLMAELQDADTLIIGPRPFITRRIIESAPKLKHIARMGVGLDNIDLLSATDNNIFVTNTPGVTSDSVAEFTMSLLLSLAKNIPGCNQAVKSGNWSGRFDLLRDNIELNGKTHGIVGLGRIGRKVAVRCKSFGMKILYNKRNRDVDFEQTENAIYVSFEQLLRESDTISLHLPLTEETLNMFAEPQFSSMKATALLINQSRGKVVNETALVRALRQKQIAGYATDVFESEPPDPASELLSFQNVIVSPHLGGSTRESRARSASMIATDVLKVFQGEPPINLVNRALIKTQ